MKILNLFFVVIFLFSLVSAQEPSCLQQIDNNSTLVFFYGDGCPHCAAAEPFLDKMQEKYNFTLIRHEVWHNESNVQIYKEFLVKYNVPQASRMPVPGFFMGDKYVIGYDNEKTTGKNLENIISSCLNNNCLQEDNKIRFSFLGRNYELERDFPIIFMGIFLGFIDGFNPCTFAILIFLLSYLFTISASKKKILQLGLIFALVIFFVYSLIMLGLINVLSFVSFKGEIKIIVSIILIVIGLINIKDFFIKGFGPSLEIPAFARPILEKYAKKATLPAIIILAVILSFVELGCTLGLPLAYVSILSERGIVGFSAFLYILWYNLFYVMPLLIIVGLVYTLALEADRAEEFRQKFRRYMKLAGGLLMLLLAFLLLFNVV